MENGECPGLKNRRCAELPTAQDTPGEKKVIRRMELESVDAGGRCCGDIERRVMQISICRHDQFFELQREPPWK